MYWKFIKFLRCASIKTLRRKKTCFAFGENISLNILMCFIFMCRLPFIANPCLFILQTNKVYICMWLQITTVPWNIISRFYNTVLTNIFMEFLQKLIELRSLLLLVGIPGFTLHNLLSGVFLNSSLSFSFIASKSIICIIYIKQ